MNEHEILTNEPQDIQEDIDSIIKGIQLNMADIELYAPVRPVQVEKESFLVLEQRGLCRLSEETRALEEARLAKLYRKKKSLRERKRYTRKRGTVHPKKKAATRRRRLEKNWRDNAFGCVISGYGSHSIDRSLWDVYVQPLWQKFDPADLTVRKAKRDWKGRYFGTKDNPYTIYALTVVHKTDGVVFDGAGLELYMLSS